MNRKVPPLIVILLLGSVVSIPLVDPPSPTAPFYTRIEDEPKKKKGHEPQSDACRAQCHPRSTRGKRKALRHSGAALPFTLANAGETNRSRGELLIREVNS